MKSDKKLKKRNKLPFRLGKEIEKKAVDKQSWLSFEFELYHHSFDTEVKNNIAKCSLLMGTRVFQKLGKKILQTDLFKRQYFLNEVDILLSFVPIEVP